MRWYNDDEVKAGAHLASEAATLIYGMGRHSVPPGQEVRAVVVAAQKMRICYGAFNTTPPGNSLVCAIEEEKDGCVTVGVGDEMHLVLRNPSEVIAVRATVAVGYVLLTE